MSDSQSSPRVFHTIVLEDFIFHKYSEREALFAKADKVARAKNFDFLRLAVKLGAITTLQKPFENEKPLSAVAGCLTGLTSKGV